MPPKAAPAKESHGVLSMSLGTATIVLYIELFDDDRNRQHNRVSSYRDRSCHLLLIVKAIPFSLLVLMLR